MLLSQIPFLAWALALALTFAPSFSLAATDKSTHIDRAARASDVLLYRYWNASNGLFGILWWQTPNLLTALSDLTIINPGRLDVAAYLRVTFEIAAEENHDFTNNYYDDEGWWALAWIKAYDLTHESKYLDKAKTIFNDMTTGLGSTCGGLWWNKDHTYTATIANELFFATASALGNRAGNDGTDYRSYASNELNWIRNSGLLTSDNVFMDGKDPTKNCYIAGPVFSYNQGVILGGLVEYHQLTGDDAALNYAHEIAHAAISKLVTSDGILTDPGDTYAPSDTIDQFKGVSVRNLAYLHAVSPSDEYKDFLQKNADSIWDHARSADGFFAPDWSGPASGSSAPAQGSAIDCFVAAAKVS